MTEELMRARHEALDAIDRQRGDWLSVKIPERDELDAASPGALRELASSIRAQSWTDRSISEEELADPVNDPGWAPSAAVRTAALLDHLSELSSPTGTPLTVPPLQPPPLSQRPRVNAAPWAQMSVADLEEKLNSIEHAGDVIVFDNASGACLVRAATWRGEIVEIVDLFAPDLKRELPLRSEGADSTGTAQGRGSKQSAADNVETFAVSVKAEQSKQDKKTKDVDGGRDSKQPATDNVEPLAASTKAEQQKQDKKKKEVDGRRSMWADALVRAGFLRGHFGPHLTAEIFRAYVVGRERLDVAVDVNVIINGLVYYIARLAPHIDFIRAAITDLEIQRLADHKKEHWRKACRVLERFPVKGPAWRSLGLTEKTSLLVARADQKGDKAPGADALMAHNFEESLLRSHGVHTVLLSSDNGLTRTLSARLRNGAVWIGYVDAPKAAERYLSPIISWTHSSASASAYSSLSILLEEILVCGISDELMVSDGVTTIELRGYLEGEHQYINDWQHPSLFVRGFGTPRIQTPRQAKWPLRLLEPFKDPQPSGARVTVEQVATALERIRSSGNSQFSREQVPKDVGVFLRAVNLMDNQGKLLEQTAVMTAALYRDVETIREIILRFEPVIKVVNAIRAGAHSIGEAKSESDLGDRTFGAAFNLALAAGLVWKMADEVGVGTAFVPQDVFREWVLKTVVESTRISRVVELAARELQLSPVRFQEALGAIIQDPKLNGKRGGSAEASPLDTRILTIDDVGRIAVQELRADDVLGLRSLEAR